MKRRDLERRALEAKRQHMEAGRPSARVCEGCGKPFGCIPIMRRYWHLRCWRAYRRKYFHQ